MTTFERAGSETEGFKRRHPRLADHPGLFDFSPPTGWAPIVEQLTTDLERLDLDIKVVQVKTKFGALRYYCKGNLTPEADELIRAAEAKCSVTCEVCGADGRHTKSRRSAVGTLCKRCEACR